MNEEETPDTPATDSQAPLRYEAVTADDYSKYLLHARKEILFILRAMRDKGDLITVYFNQGKDFLLTALLDVTEAGMLLDPGSNAEMNRRALESDKLIFIATHERVKIQFTVRGLAPAQYQGREAFRAALPAELLRLQRREFFRLATPIIHPLLCVVPLKAAGGAPATLEAVVTDISGGGVALVLPADAQGGFETGSLYERCSIELPEVGRISASLRVCNRFESMLPTGAKSTRIGCQFINLPASMLTLIQRYIMRIERERKARESGLL